MAHRRNYKREPVYDLRENIGPCIWAASRIGYGDRLARAHKMRKGERCVWCWGVTLLVLFLSLPILYLVSQSDTVERYVASRVFNSWIELGHPEHSVLVWDRIRGTFPFSFKVFGSRWRDPACLRSERASHHDCVTAFAPLIDVRLHPISFLWEGKMDVERVVVPQLAVRSNTSTAHPAHAHRTLLSVGREWPFFNHLAEFRTFRVDRVSLIPPNRMLAAVEELIAHPRSMVRADHGPADMMVFGSARIAPNGGDWELTATAYTIDDVGDFATHEGHHAWVHVRGDGESRRVSGETTFTYADNTRGSGTGAADWAALFGGPGEALAEFEAEGQWGRAHGRVGLDPLLWCNISAPGNITVEGHLGSLHEPTSWPADVRVVHPRANAHCGPSFCTLEAYGVEVVLRPLQTGVEIDHDFGTARVTTCGGRTNSSTWYEMGVGVAGSRGRVCGVLDTLVGEGRFEYAGGRIVDAALSGEREGVVFRGVTAERVSVSANLTALDVDVYAPAWGRRRGPDHTHFHITPTANWTLTTSDGDWLRGWVEPSRTLVVDGGSVRGYQVDAGRAWSSVDEGWVEARVSNGTSWIRLHADGDWRARSWWDRLRAYHIAAHIEHGLSAWGVEVAGLVDVVANGGGRALPTANITLTGGSIYRPENLQRVEHAGGTLVFPDGTYALTGTYHSPVTSASFASEGYVALSPTSIEGDTYTNYRAQDGSWDRINTAFEWEWGHTL